MLLYITRTCWQIAEKIFACKSSRNFGLPMVRAINMNYLGVIKPIEFFLYFYWTIYSSVSNSANQKLNLHKWNAQSRFIYLICQCHIMILQYHEKERALLHLDLDVEREYTSTILLSWRYSLIWLSCHPVLATQYSKLNA